MQMPTAYVVLLTDGKTERTLTGKRNAFRCLINEIICVEFPEENDLHYRSRFLKTTLPQYITGNFLYIDCDTIICEDLSEIANLDINLGAVFNSHVLLSKSISCGYHHFLDVKTGFSSTENSEFYYNGGLLFCKNNESSRRFFEKWNELYLISLSKGVKFDQPALNQANFLLNGVISELSGIWNCQLKRSGAIKYLTGAKILHYLHSSPEKSVYLLGQHAVFQQIKDAGGITKEILEMLQNPKIQFDDKSCVYFYDELDNIPFVNKHDVRTIGIKGLCKILMNRILSKFFNLKK
jgi:hypothetical protein